MHKPLRLMHCEDPYHIGSMWKSETHLLGGQRRLPRGGTPELDFGVYRGSCQTKEKGYLGSLPGWEVRAFALRLTIPGVYSLTWPAKGGSRQ